MSFLNLSPTVETLEILETPVSTVGEDLGNPGILEILGFLGKLKSPRIQ